jgi:hypothetical protein
MSDVNLDFNVSNNSIDFNVESNDITITPTDIQLTLFPGGAAAGGSTGMLQYNNNGFFGGVPDANYDGSNLTFQVASTKITGGNNHYYLQTDGTGNLTWSIGTGNMQGNGTVAGANTQIQYNADGMNFGGNAGFTFEAPSGNVNIPGNLIVVGNINAGFINANVSNANYANFAGNVINSSQPNITSLGTLINLSVTGNITGANYAGALNSLPYGFENITLNGGSVPVSSYNVDILSNAITYCTGAAIGNLTLNFRGNSTTTLNSILSNGQSVTSTYAMTTTAGVYTVTAAQVDGSAQTIKWVNGLAPVGVANTITSFTFTIIKISNTPTYTVLGSATRYA